MEQRTILKITLGFLMVLALVLGSFIVTAIAKNSRFSTEDEFAGVATVQISEQQAISIASGVVEGTVDEVEFAGGVYTVEVMNGETEYDIKINAMTGKVIQVQKENDLGRKDLEVIKPKISEEQAKKIAKSAVSGKVTDIDFKKVNGLYVYEVEIQDNGEEADVLVNMMTGKVEGVEREVIEDDDEEEEDEAEDVPITGTALERASAVALAYMGEGRVTDTEIGDEEGYYEIEIRLDNGKEVDVHLDENFNVLSTEEDDEDDD